MADKAYLEQLASDIQKAVTSYDPSNKGAWVPIQQAAEKIRRAVEPPAVYITKQNFSTLQNVCLLAAAEMGIIQELAASPDKSKTAAELAQVSGCNELFVSRIMRMMVGIGFVDETGFRTYKANKFTIAQSDPGFLGYILLTNEFIYPLADKMRQYIRYMKKRPNDPSFPPAYDFAVGEELWDTLKNNPVQKKGFDDAMTTTNQTFGIPWCLKYPVEEKLVRSTQAAGTTAEGTPINGTDPSAASKPIIVDIGGNQGVDLQYFVKLYPQIDARLVLQDLPETLQGIPPGFLDPKIEQMAYNFFEEQPIKGAEIYYLKSILHDWPLATCQHILSIIAKAMAPHSRLLLNEMVLTDLNAGQPQRKIDMDILMLLKHNGAERTKTEWEELLGGMNPPLEITGIYELGGDLQSVIEARIKQS